MVHLHNGIHNGNHILAPACACRSLLLQFGFWRLVLDEAQLVAASSSVAALMTSALWRRHAWVVTGTPITSRVEEIQVYSLSHTDTFCSCCILFTGCMRLSCS